MRTAIMSIKPEFSDLIFQGKKAVELRRSNVSLRPDDELFIYETHPTKVLRGRAIVRKVEYLPLRKLWKRYGKRAGISESVFKQYFEDCVSGSAIILEDIQEFPVQFTLAQIRLDNPGWQPPVSYQFVHSDSRLSRWLKVAKGPREHRRSVY